MLPPGSAKQPPPVCFEIRHAPGEKPGLLNSPDGKLTVRIVGDLQAQIVEASSGNRVGPVLRHSQRRDGMRIHTWAFSPDGNRLATASSEGDGEDTVGEVRVWDMATGKLLAVATDARYELGRVYTLTFSGDGRVVLIHCEDISGN
jgi:WD40 repeat protein